MRATRRRRTVATSAEEENMGQLWSLALHRWAGGQAIDRRPVLGDTMGGSTPVEMSQPAVAARSMPTP